MIVPIDTNLKIKFTLEEDQEPKTQFVCRTLSASQRAELLQNYFDTDNIKKTNEFNLDCISKCLLEIESTAFSAMPRVKTTFAGKEINAIDLQWLDSNIDHITLIHLANKIIELNSVKDLKKKSLEDSHTTATTFASSIAMNAEGEPTKGSEAV